jgi:hypothetical protein
MLKKRLLNLYYFRHFLIKIHFQYENTIYVKLTSVLLVGIFLTTATLFGC